MNDRLAPDHACTSAACTIEWLLEPGGPADPAWRARARAEFQSAPFDCIPARRRIA